MPDRSTTNFTLVTVTITIHSTYTAAEFPRAAQKQILLAVQAVLAFIRMDLREPRSHLQAAFQGSLPPLKSIYSMYVSPFQ